MKGSFTSSINLALTSDYPETRDICLVPYHVTFASLNRVKFYRDFNMEASNDTIPHLEKEAHLTVSKLKSSLLYRKGIIENITSDINKSERIIYFDVILAPKIPQTSFVELLGYLNKCLYNS